MSQSTSIWHIPNIYHIISVYIPYTTCLTITTFLYEQSGETKREFSNLLNFDICTLLCLYHKAHTINTASEVWIPVRIWCESLMEQVVTLLYCFILQHVLWSSHISTWLTSWLWITCLSSLHNPSIHPSLPQYQNTIFLSFLRLRSTKIIICYSLTYLYYLNVSLTAIISSSLAITKYFNIINKKRLKPQLSGLTPRCIWEELGTENQPDSWMYLRWRMLL